MGRQRTAGITPGWCSVLSVHHPALDWDGGRGQGREVGREDREGFLSSHLHMELLQPTGWGWGGADWLEGTQGQGCLATCLAHCQPTVSRSSTWRKWEWRLVVVFQSVFCHLPGISHVLHSKSRLCRNTEKFLHLQKYIFSLKQALPGTLGQRSAVYNQGNSKEWSWYKFWVLLHLGQDQD